MSSFFYGKIAATNLKSNRKTYYPYMLTAIVTVVMFYNIAAISFHSSTIKSANIASLMSFGTMITGIFSVVLLFYTNSFLMKRRTKEFGLFNILGMEKKHIGRVMLWETVYTSIISVGVGIGLGIAFNKLITLMLYKIIKYNPKYNFQVNMSALLWTLALFGVIFLLILLNNLRQVHFAKAIDLLKGSNVGEKEPKTKWIMAVLGFVCLGTGYGISIMVKSPLDAFNLFFLAVLLVIAGTYFLFIAGSIAVLKGLKKNKAYYYKTNHFTAISGMIYRMKKNAAGLATICILSTAVLVMISTTVSMYFGMNDILNTRYPSDISARAVYAKDSNFNVNDLEKHMHSVAVQKGYTPTDWFSYKCLNVFARREGDTFIGDPDIDSYQYKSSATILNFITIDEYNKLQGTNESLENNEVIVHNNSNEDLLQGSYVTFIDTQYKIKQNLKDLTIRGDYFSDVESVVTVVLPSEQDFYKFYDKEMAIFSEQDTFITYISGYNIDGTDEAKIDIYNNLKKFKDARDDYSGNDNVSMIFECKTKAIPDFYELYGGLLFLCMFLGMQFLMATVLIIYYKQVVEGYEDKDRFVIMRKVGMSDKEVRKSIKSQILSVFALPLLVAVIHVFAAFSMVKKLLAVLQLNNAPLFFLCTVITMGVFAIGYVVVYGLTAKVYYRTINSK